MIAYKSIIFLSSYTIGCIGSVLYNPMLGVLTYLFTYFFAPRGQWWGQYIAELGLRQSFIAGVAIALGMIIHKRKLQFFTLFHNQEILLILFVIITWLSTVIGVGESVDQNYMKMIKVAVVILMASHIITIKKNYELLILLIVFSVLYLSYQANVAPDSAFFAGRLNLGIGGNDFRESNFFSAFLAIMLPIICVKFLRSGWMVKILCAPTIILALNAIILCRSRGAFLACFFGAIAMNIYAPKKRRVFIFILTIISILIVFRLADLSFLNRMQTINTDTSEMDKSSHGRVLAWKAAFQMVSDYPFGIGEGNFKYLVGDYNAVIEGIDTHSGYMRCLSELGIQGFVIYCLLFYNAFRILSFLNRKIKLINNEREREDFYFYILSLRISLVILMTVSITMSTTYVEFSYWIVMLPVFLYRTIEQTLDQNLLRT